MVYWRIASTSQYGVRAASVSGYTLTLGTGVEIPGFTWGTDNAAVPFLPVVNQYAIFNSTNFARTFTVSGTTITLRTQTLSGGFFPSSYATIADPNSMRFFLINCPTTTSVYYTPTSNLTSPLSDSNFLGLSDGAYTNGQTATIKCVGGAASGLSELTPGAKYYAFASGSLLPLASASYAGLAVNSTTLLIKG
jgi:hypothetical protein